MDNFQMFVPDDQQYENDYTQQETNLHHATGVSPIGGYDTGFDFSAGFPPGQQHATRRQPPTPTSFQSHPNARQPYRPPVRPPGVPPQQMQGQFPAAAGRGRGCGGYAGGMPTAAMMISSSMLATNCLCTDRLDSSSSITAATCCRTIQLTLLKTPCRPAPTA